MERTGVFRGVSKSVGDADDTVSVGLEDLRQNKRVDSARGAGFLGHPREVRYPFSYKAARARRNAAMRPKRNDDD
jgi:hypothetical protein